MERLNNPAAEVKEDLKRPLLLYHNRSTLTLLSADTLNITER